MSSPKIGLVIPVFNRPNYVRRCFDSLSEIQKRPDYLVIVDDGSDRETKNLIASFAGFPCDLMVVCADVNRGVRQSLLMGIEEAFNSGCDIVINLDSDSIVKPDFIDKLVALHCSYSPTPVVSGFNCCNPRSVNLKQETGFCYKEHLNGINMCFNRHQYEKHIKPNLKKVGNWDFNSSVSMANDNVPRLVITPSVVQHIGMVSSMGHTAGGVKADYASDFKPLILENVTLFGLDTKNHEGIKRASRICQENIQFGDVKIITDKVFADDSLQIGRESYSRFMFKELNRYVDTSHVLVIQHDGYVQNYKAWDKTWMEFDFIGSPWKWYPDKQVGNGGFSLRSKKLLKILANDQYFTEFMPEDDAICRKYRDYLETNYDIKFAPLEVAEKFGIEGWAQPLHERVYSGQFGYHGYHLTGLPIPPERRKI